MKALITPLCLLILWAAFAGAHAFFVEHFLYWEVIWLDLVMHTWGGALLVASWYYIKSTESFSRLFRRAWFHPVLGLIVLMVGWEVFKYYIGSITSDAYVLDTALDLAFGSLGGLISFWFIRSRTIR